VHECRQSGIERRLLLALAIAAALCGTLAGCERNTSVTGTASNGGVTGELRTQLIVYRMTGVAGTDVRGCDLSRQRGGHHKQPQPHPTIRDRQQKLEKVRSLLDDGRWDNAVLVPDDVVVADRLPLRDSLPGLAWMAVIAAAMNALAWPEG
jgi:hypothetical protein